MSNDKKTGIDPPKSAISDDEMSDQGVAKADLVAGSYWGEDAYVTLDKLNVAKSDAYHAPRGRSGMDDLVGTASHNSQLAKGETYLSDEDDDPEEAARKVVEMVLFWSNHYNSKKDAHFESGALQQLEWERDSFIARTSNLLKRANLESMSLPMDSLKDRVVHGGMGNYALLESDISRIVSGDFKYSKGDTKFMFDLKNSNMIARDDEGKIIRTDQQMLDYLKEHPQTTFRVSQETYDRLYDVAKKIHKPVGSNRELENPLMTPIPEGGLSRSTAATNNLFTPIPKDSPLMSTPADADKGTGKDIFASQSTPLMTPIPEKKDFPEGSLSQKFDQQANPLVSAIDKEAPAMSTPIKSTPGMSTAVNFGLTS